MKFIRATVRHTWGWTLRLGVAFILLAAVLVSLGRAALPYLGEFRADLERGLGEYLHATVRIDSVGAAWEGWGPAIRLSGFRLYDPHSGARLAGFERAVATLNLPRSLLAGHAMLTNVRLQGAHLSLERTAEGTLRLSNHDARQPSPPLPRLAAWLFDIGSLDLQGAEFEVQSADRRGPPLVFRDLHLSLRSVGGQRHVGLTLILPGELGGLLRAAVALQGEANDPTTWRAAFYASARGLVLSGWPLPVSPKAGRGDLEVWGDWRDKFLTSAVGRARIRGLALPDLPGTEPLREVLARLPEVSGDFAWRRGADGWQLRSDWAGGRARRETVKRVPIDLTLRESGAGAPRFLEGRLGGLHVQDLAAAALSWLDESRRAVLAKIDPRGELPELAFRLGLPADGRVLALTDHSGEAAASGRCASTTSVSRCGPGGGVFEGLPNLYALAARIESLDTQAWHEVPGIRNVNAVLSLNQDGGYVQLDGRDLGVDAAALFRAPLGFDTLQGRVEWRREDGELRLQAPGFSIANAALHAKLHGSATLYDDGSSPLLDLRLDCRDMDVRHVREYLPAAIMRPKLVEWLDRALVSGRAPAGNVVLRGRATDFPFDHGHGLFEARFQVQDTILDYFPEWPRIEELEAEVVFRNRGFQIEAVAGKMFDVDLDRVQGRIEDLKHALLRIEGQARGPAQSMLRFLRESPLARRAGSYVAGMQAAGENTLDLRLAIPFDHSPIRVEGALDFAGGEVRLPAWEVDLTEIQGRLGFTEAGLSAEDLQLRFRGEPVRLDIDPGKREDGRGETRFQMRGRLDPHVLLGSRGADLAPYVSGRALWDAVLAIPAARPEGSSDLDLRLTSQLDGIEVKLPVPFGKPADTARTFTVHAGVSGEGTVRARLDYGPEIRAAVELGGFPAQPRLSRGELRIDSGEAQLPEEPGLSVVAHLPRFELSGSAAGAAPGGLLPSWVRSVDLRLDELMVGGQAFKAIRVQAKPQGAGLGLMLQGQDLTGNVFLPTAPAPGTPLRVELGRLALRRGEEGAQAARTEPADPRSLPPLRLRVDELSLDGKALGRLRLAAIPQPGGLRLADVELRSDLHRITASGAWLKEGQGQSSRLQAELHSRELGKTLQAFGFAAPLERGETDAELSLTWPASFPELAPSLLSGDLSLHIGTGQLLDVEPGVGRMLGLFNLYTLSRRLALDFTDLFDKGLGFDRINGSFTLKDGQAYTKDLALEGPSAQIFIAGRLGLKDRDYDAIVTVLPRVGSTLGLAGTLAGGPAVGAALFVAEWLFKRGIDQAAGYQYKVTGSWEDPVVRRLEEASKPADKPSSRTR